MDSILIQYVGTPFGELILGSFREQLCLCDWRHRKNRTQIDDRICRGLKADFHEATSGIIDMAVNQLREYFSGTRKSFTIPLLPVGSGFQKSVWSELLKIEYGTTETYSGLAQKIGQPLAIRAIASANGANGLSIFIPCHRVIGSRGEMTGYAGGIAAKSKLLRLEGSILQKQLPLFGPDAFPRTSG